MTIEELELQPSNRLPADIAKSIAELDCEIMRIESRAKLSSDNFKKQIREKMTDLDRCRKEWAAVHGQV